MQVEHISSYYAFDKCSSVGWSGGTNCWVGDVEIIKGNERWTIPEGEIAYMWSVDYNLYGFSCPDHYLCPDWDWNGGSHPPPAGSAYNCWMTYEQPKGIGCIPNSTTAVPWAMHYYYYTWGCQ